MNGLPYFEVDLHGSGTIAHDVGDNFALYFSRYLDCEICLVYIRQNSREVLGSIAPHSRAALLNSTFPPRLFASFPFIQAERIVFTDIGQYLIVTKESNSEVSSRLADGHRWISRSSDQT